MKKATMALIASVMMCAGAHAAGTWTQGNTATAKLVVTRDAGMTLSLTPVSEIHTKISNDQALITMGLDNSQNTGVPGTVGVIVNAKNVENGAAYAIGTNAKNKIKLKIQSGYQKYVKANDAATTKLTGFGWVNTSNVSGKRWRVKIAADGAQTVAPDTYTFTATSWALRD